jgi:hypothetical protein
MRATINGLLNFAALGGTTTPVRLAMSRVLSDVLADLSSQRSIAQVEVAPELPGHVGR